MSLRTGTRSGKSEAVGGKTCVLSECNITSADCLRVSPACLPPFSHLSPTVFGNNSLNNSLGTTAFSLLLPLLYAYFSTTLHTQFVALDIPDLPCRLVSPWFVSILVWCPLINPNPGLYLPPSKTEVPLSTSLFFLVYPTEHFLCSIHLRPLTKSLSNQTNPCILFLSVLFHTLTDKGGLHRTNKHFSARLIF